MMWLTVLLLIVIIICFMLMVIRWSTSKTVPGPIGLPLLGYYPFLGKHPNPTLHQLADKYGEIMKINLLGEDFYIISSLETVKKVLVKDGENFMGRPADKFNLISKLYSNKAYMYSQLEFYKAQRKFLIPKLSLLGITKSDFETRIHELCEDLVEELRKRQIITDMGQLLSNVASNVILRLVFNEKYDINDPIYVALLHNVEIMNETFDYMNATLVGKLFYLKCRLNFRFWRKLISARESLRKFMMSHIKNRAANKEYPTQYNDLLDYCLEQSSGPNGQYFEIDTIARIFLLLFFAGTDTTASTVFHGITLFAKHPEIQRKLISELEVFDKYSRISFKDVENLHYTRACIAEIQRFASSVPLNLVHVNSSQTISQLFQK
ncbi:cytochrome P450 2U1-like protein [Leptotrombidium deliense]|uniref:Cytochrome P450 2U1-like protein n=1 Tax=Leptotrombidium deliense TaxID=299467 RepID=A0A443S092_9ACAR|nr:cytochrome P450 2U1-like protein [Leptotrombidium deliense]